MRKSITINKYWILIVIVLLISGYTILPLIIKAITYDATNGVIEQYSYTETKFRRKSRATSFYPLVGYQVGDSTYYCWGSNMMREDYLVGDSVRVIYNPSEPWDAHVFTFLGFAAPTLMWVVPVIFIICLLFGLDYIPRQIRIRTSFS